MTFQTKGRVIFFSTNNINKFKELSIVLTEYKIAVGMLRVKATEIQSDSLEEIAEKTVIETFKKCRLPIIVEDAGLFIEALNGFPGPYTAYVYKTIGNRGILHLMEGIENRKSIFKSLIAYYAEDMEKPLCFEGEVRGKIIRKERKMGKSIFGFDPIFRPKGNEKTFAEMPISEKNSFSHRAKAAHKFAESYKRSVTSTKLLISR